MDSTFLGTMNFNLDLLGLFEKIWVKDNLQMRSSNFWVCEGKKFTFWGEKFWTLLWVIP